MKPQTMPAPEPVAKPDFDPLDAPGTMSMLVIVTVGCVFLSQFTTSGMWLILLAGLFGALALLFWGTARYRVIVYRFMGRNYAVGRMVGKANRIFVISVNLNKEELVYKKGFYNLDPTAVYDEGRVPTITWTIGNPDPWKYSLPSIPWSATRTNDMMKAKTTLATLIAVSSQLKWLQYAFFAGCGALIGGALAAYTSYNVSHDVGAMSAVCSQALNATIAIANSTIVRAGG